MKIKSLYIHSFRGVPNELELDFTDKRGLPKSVILYGDNGTGKSTIADAIELCLQARIARSEILKNPLRASIGNYNSKYPIGADIKITFDNDSEFERGIKVKNEDGYIKYYLESNLIHPNFSLVPVVLRRNDIINYSVIPREQRQILFFKFLYPKYYPKLDDIVVYSGCWENDPVILSLKDEYIELKKKRRLYVSDLEEFIGVDKSNIPFGENKKFSNYILQCLGRRKYRKKEKSYILPSKKFRGKDERKLNRLYDLIWNCNEEILNITERIKSALDISTETSLERRKRNADILSQASKYLSAAFQEISTADYVESISLSLGAKTDASMDIKVCLKNGHVVYPSDIFSEANYDLMVLLLYISIIRVCAQDKEQSKVIVLDDVLQSVDSTIRTNFINYVLRECRDWQFFITTHDRLWLEQLEYLFSANSIPYKELDFKNWNFSKGPEIVDSEDSNMVPKLVKAMDLNDINLIASSASVTLENICQQLSFSLQLSVHRKYGDRYTIADIWPGLCKKFKGTDLKKDLDKLNVLLLIRNSLGCHANEWAKSYSDKEIMDFAKLVLDLYHKVYCPKCMKWISSVEKSSSIVAECNCRSIQYTKNKSTK